MMKLRKQGRSPQPRSIALSPRGKRVWASVIARSLGTIAACWLASCLVSVSSADPPLERSADRYGVPVQRTYIFHEARNASIPYALFVPTGYDPAKPAPLVVLLHGLFSNPWQVIHYLGIVQQAEKRGYIVAAPSGYNDVGWFGSRGPGKNFVLGTRQRSDEPDNLGELSEEDVLNVLSIVCKDYSVDPKRIYLMGHSMGGGGTLYLGMKYKERWAALAALAPAIYSNPDALEGIPKMPVIIVQGDRDGLVNVENTRRWVARMKDLNMDFQYIEIPGGDHIFSICFNPTMISEVFDFFDHHSK